MKFRVVRFKISEDTYESIITNLPREIFSQEQIKQLYHMRWGIEISFKTLKYSVGLKALHTKKVEFILQEIYAKLVLFNLCQIATNDIILRKKDTKHEYQLNTCALIEIIRHFLRKTEYPPHINKLIQKYILPIRVGRKVPRGSSRKNSSIPMNYRIA